MGLFKKPTEEEKAQRQQQLDEINQKKQARISDIQDKSEKKAREKAAKSGFNVDEALYVFSCLPNDDEKGTINMPFGAVFHDRVMKFQKRWTGNVLEEIPIKNVSSVEVSKGLLPTVTVYATGNSITFKVGVEAQKIASCIRDLIPGASTGNSNVDPIAQVEKLAQLLEKGLLTKEEFDIKKKQILDL